MVDIVSHWHPITIQPKSPIKDFKDHFILSKEKSVPVDFVMNGDKNLTELKSYARIPILSYSEFKKKVYKKT